ncbi:MAG TPA: TIGR00296 family protein [Thermoplasmata archaeon]|nr:TIGR00296 family protein [Thermoplasmata archaeon]
MLDSAEGERAVRLAREALERAFGSEVPREPGAWAKTLDLPPGFDRPSGVFVTLRTEPGEMLRGCIGFPEPVHPLRVAIARAAHGAAFEDPRFPALEESELDQLSVEVSVLTLPTRIEVSPRGRLPEFVAVGRDGLIVRRGPVGGLLLPQVAVEQGWDSGRFLAEACIKAGLPSNAWRDEAVGVFRFACDVFREPPRAAQASRPSRRRAGRPGPRA